MNLKLPPKVNNLKLPAKKESIGGSRKATGNETQPSITQAVAFKQKEKVQSVTNENSNHTNTDTTVNINNNINNSKQHNSTIDKPIEMANDADNNTIKNRHEDNLVNLPQAVASNFIDLQQKLLANNPDIRSNLIIIHRELAKDPAIVTILTPEQRGVIFTGYSKQTGIEVVKASGTGKGKKINVSELTTDDFD